MQTLFLVLYALFSILAYVFHHTHSADTTDIDIFNPLAYTRQVCVPGHLCSKARCTLH